MVSVNYDKVVILWPVLTLLTFIAAVTVHYCTSFGVLSDESVADVFDEYDLMITPSRWVFGIWPFIDLWQLLWMLYTLCLCIKQEMDQIIMGRAFFLSFILSNVLTILWVIAWTRHHLIWGSVGMVLTAMSLCVNALCAHCYVVIKADTNSVHFGYDGDVPSFMDEYVRTTLMVLAVNGTSFYAFWMVFVSALSLGVMLCYEADVSKEAASFMVLGLFTAILVVFWSFDIVIRSARIVARWTFMPYLVILMIFSGMISAHEIHSEECPPSVMVVILLVISSIAFGLKLHFALCGWSNDSSFDGELLSVDY